MYQNGQMRLTLRLTEFLEAALTTSMAQAFQRLIAATIPPRVATTLSAFVPHFI